MSHLKFIQNALRFAASTMVPCPKDLSQSSQKMIRRRKCDMLHSRARMEVTDGRSKNDEEGAMAASACPIGQLLQRNLRMHDSLYGVDLSSDNE
jgi:hypothetical protein